MVASIARQVFIPFSVGGGIRGLQDMQAVLHAGAEKVSVNSLAVLHPEIIREGANAFGNQCVVLGMDARAVGVSSQFPSGYEVVIKGGREPMGLDAVEWALRAQDLGAGEICLNSIDADGTREGYECVLTERVAESVEIPVIASGGAGNPGHITDLLLHTSASAALIASMVHFGDYTLAGIKEQMRQAGIQTRIKE
jgi:cyclase